jgi:hypothetical protein
LDVRSSEAFQELRALLPALRQLPELAKCAAFLLRSLERVGSLESQCGRGWIPLGPIAIHLQRLADAAAMTSAATATGQSAPRHTPPAEQEELPHVTLAELVRRIEALEVRRNPASLAPGNAARVAHSNALRQAIADILGADPGATGPVVLERLGKSTRASSRASAPCAGTSTRYAAMAPCRLDRRVRSGVTRQLQ